jgi:ferredoxin
MQSVMQAAEENGYPEDARHLEYFNPPETPDYVNYPFTIEIPDRGKIVQVQEDEHASDALLAAGIHVDLKCSDGLCGVCKCTVIEGDVEHRDFVLSKADRETQMILCQSRAAEPDGFLKIKIP